MSKKFDALDIFSAAAVGIAAASVVAGVIYVSKKYRDYIDCVAAPVNDDAEPACDSAEDETAPCTEGESAAEKIANFAENMTESVSEKAEEAAEKAEDIVEAVVETAEDAAQFAVEKLEEAAEELKKEDTEE